MFKKLIILSFKLQQKLSPTQYVNILSIGVGLLVGLSAVIIKNLVFLIQKLLKDNQIESIQHYLYFAYPTIGILLVLLFSKYILKQKLNHGIPSVLYSIAEENANIKPHNTFSSIITSALTVGFGGSVGLEGPSVATGAAIGSNLGKTFGLNYRQKIQLIGAASASVIAAIFQAPIAGIIFAIEVIMIDLTVASLIPLLISSITAVLTSYLLMGSEVLYHVDITNNFEVKNTWIYILLGITTGLFSVYFTKVYLGIQQHFQGIKNDYLKLFYGGTLLGILIFLFPALFGEGYEVTNEALAGNINFVTNSSILSQFSLPFITLIVLGLIILLKVFASAFTFGAGGIGGIFAPSLFIGANIGLFFALSLKAFLGIDIGITKFTLTAMAGTLSGILHAPLMAIFLIAEITGGYKLFVPLMLVSTISYLTSKFFVKHSVYVSQLVQKGQILTHDKDANVLKLLNINKLIERDFKSIYPNACLGDLVECIKESSRNIFPVIKPNGDFVGVIILDDVRNIIFDHEKYAEVKLEDYIFKPGLMISPDASMEEVARRLQKSDVYNIPVVDNGKYVGFVSRANVFAEYRKILKEVSYD